MKTMICIFLFLSASLNATAQDDLPDPWYAEVTTEDGVKLIGDFWSAGDEIGSPAVLLLHMLGSNRQAWEPLIAPLYDTGFHVLAVDLRGHGESGGDEDWIMAETDVQLWLDWLKEQMGVTSVSIVGASIGSNLALIGCANDPDCITAVALSPGLDYKGVMPQQAVIEGLANRPVLLVASHGDGASPDDVRQMASSAQGEIGMRIYTGRAHGTNLFRDKGERINWLIIDWLVEHTAEDF